jgi:predicted DNA-binding transcriptional regulator AlpA
MNRSQTQIRESIAKPAEEPLNVGAPLLKEQHIAGKCRVSVASVRRWRLLHEAPKFLKIGAASVRYRLADVEAWLNS